jgi:hypothetical protein
MRFSQSELRVFATEEDQKEATDQKLGRLSHASTADETWNHRGHRVHRDTAKRG